MEHSKYLIVILIILSLVILSVAFVYTGVVYAENTRTKGMKNSTRLYLDHENNLPIVAIEVIKKFEGYSSKAYPDPLSGGEPFTIGYGSTLDWKKAKVRRGMVISERDAEKLLIFHLVNDYIPFLKRIPNWENFNPNQKAALISFGYNLGADFFGSPGFATITRVLRTGNYKDLPSALMLYTNPGSNCENGLRRRRRAEGRLFFTPAGEDVLTSLGY